MYRRLFIALFALVVASPLVAQPTHQVEQTLSIIKPDAVSAKKTGEILTRLEKNGLRIAAIKMVELTEPQAMQFYAEHKDRPFYLSLVEFMSSGPIVVLVLEGPNAIRNYRNVIGATNPAQATPGSIRRDFGSGLQTNAVHGSDSSESAQKEIQFFFKAQEILNSINSQP